MLDWLKSLFQVEPATYFVAELHTSEFLTDARLEPNLKGEHTHSLVFEFIEPIRDGNDVSHLNLVMNGRVINRLEVLTGETATSLSLNPDLWALEIVVVNSDGKACATDKLEITEEVIE